MDKVLDSCASTRLLCTENCGFPHYSTLRALTFSGDATPARESVGKLQAPQNLADFVREAERRQGFPRGCQGPSRASCFRMIQQPSVAAFTARRWSVATAEGTRHRFAAAFRLDLPPSLRGMVGSIGRRTLWVRARRNPRGPSGLPPGFGRHPRPVSGFARVRARTARGELSLCCEVRFAPGGPRAPSKVPSGVMLALRRGPRFVMRADVRTAAAIGVARSDCRRVTVRKIPPLSHAGAGNGS